MTTVFNLLTELHSTGYEITCHLGLSMAEGRQWRVDISKLGCHVSTNRALLYDAIIDARTLLEAYLFDEYDNSPEEHSV